MTNEKKLDQQQTKILESQLPKQVCIEASKYRKWQDAQAYLAGRYLLVNALEKLNFKIDLNKELKYNSYGRPYLPRGVDFNISHSGDFIALVISDAQRVGIDIEKICEVNIADFNNQLTNSELKKIYSADNPYSEFYKYWTIKEAAIKADGRGLQIDLKNIEINNNAFIENVEWFMKEIKIAKGYMAHIATNLFPPTDIRYEIINIPYLH